MTQKVDHIPEHEKNSLRNRLTSVFADAGLSNFFPTDFVSVTDEGVSFAPISFSSAQRFTNHLQDLTQTVGTASVSTTVQTNSPLLQVAVEECHTVPTGYSPARIVHKAST